MFVYNLSHKERDPSHTSFPSSFPNFDTETRGRGLTNENASANSMTQHDDPKKKRKLKFIDTLTTRNVTYATKRMFSLTRILTVELVMRGYIVECTFVDFFIRSSILQKRH